MMALTSGKPGVGSKFDGISTNTPLTPVKAAVSASASFMSARATSQPRSTVTGAGLVERALERSRAGSQSFISNGRTNPNSTSSSHTYIFLVSRAGSEIP